MADFVPEHFESPLELIGAELVLEPLGPEHNERDYAAWTSGIEHIRATPGLEDWSWPHEMTLEENLADLEMHARHFASREGFDSVRCVAVHERALRTAALTSLDDAPESPGSAAGRGDNISGYIAMNSEPRSRLHL